ncbi:histidine kinase [bacterium]|nr:histidine kinase [bacterium]
MAVLFGVWTFVGLFFASQNYLMYSYRQPIHWSDSLMYALPEWYTWGLLSPVILALGRRFPIQSGLLRRLPIHLLACAGLAVLHLTVYSLVNILLRSEYSTAAYIKAIQSTLIFKFHWNVLAYWVILGVQQGVNFYKSYRESELRSAQLQSQLVQAQLQALKTQLNPHFLFNTLHAITALIHTKPDEAERMIAQLSDLLRLSLDYVGVQEVALFQEMEFLNKYLEIEKTRLGDRLQIVTAIQTDTLQARVPNLLLQPIVENAIRHGIAPFTRAGILEISSFLENDRLNLVIRDNGGGLNGKKPTEGIGLSNTRSRLKQLYGTQQTFELKSNESGGVTVTITIPFNSI